METLNALGRLNQVPLDMTLEGLRSIGQTQQADQIGLQELMRKQAQARAMDPMLVQQQQTANNQGLANLAKTTRENTEADYTSKARMDAELHKAYASASEADVKGAMARFQQLASSMDPRERQIGITGLQSSKDWLMQKETNDRHLEGVRLQGANALAVARENNRGRIELKGMAGAGGKAPLSIEDAIAAGKMNYEKAATAYQMKADNETDPVLKQAYENRAMKYEIANLKAKQAAGQATPKVDAGAVAGLPTTGGAPPTPALGGGAAPAPKPKAGPTQADLEFTAKKHGLTVEQVKAKLGIK